MNPKKINANSSIQDLSAFLNNAGDAARIRAKEENGTTVLYVRNRSLLDVLKETVSKKHQMQVNVSRQSAKKIIENILNKSDKGGRLDSALMSISQHLNKKDQDIHVAKIRTKINDLDTSMGVFKIDRDAVHLAWHASLDEFIFTDGISEADGIQKLQSIGNMTAENKQTLTNLIQHAYPEILESDQTKDPIKKGLEALTYFMKSKDGKPEVGGVDYVAITKFIRIAHTAISELAKKTKNETLLSQFDVEPLKSAKLFFSAFDKPRVTPLKIQITDPIKTKTSQKWEELMNDLMIKDANFSKTEALEIIALQCLEDRKDSPNETINIFLPINVTENEMQAAFFHAQCVFRDRG